MGEDLHYYVYTTRDAFYAGTLHNTQGTKPAPTTSRKSNRSPQLLLHVLLRFLRLRIRS
jgi:hypothetical protein